MMWPFTNKQAPVETKSLADPGPDLEAIFAGIVPGSISVSTAQALTVPAVQAAIRLISEAAASLDVKVVERAGDTYEERPDHPAAKLLQGNVNGWTSGYELVRDLVAAALVNDRGGLAYVTKVRGEPREIVQYRDSIITVVFDTVTNEPRYEVNGKAVPSRNIVHVRGLFGKSPLTLAREAIGAAKAMEQYAGQLFQNGAKPGGILLTPKPIGDVGVTKMLAGWKAAFGGAQNAGKTAILWDGTTFEQMAMNSTDAQFLENRKYQTLEIARAFRVPPAMLYDLDRATWSNGEQQGKEFLSYSLEPWLKVLEAALGRALLTPEEQSTYRVCFDRDDLTRADLTARATAYASLVTSRIYSPNELRAWDGAAPYAGGNSYLNPAIDVAKPANDNPPPKQEAA